MQALRPSDINAIPHLRAFLNLIRWSEGTSTSPITKHDGYDVIVSGVNGSEVFTDFSHHPFDNRPAKMVRPGLFSTASGGYQILHVYWSAYSITLKLPDFLPSSQDAVAVQQVTECKALRAIETGDIETAIQFCSRIWASFPGNNYKQGGKSMSELLAKFAELDRVQ